MELISVDDFDTHEMAAHAGGIVEDEGHGFRAAPGQVA
jgi:hypothetical protein